MQNRRAALSFAHGGEHHTGELKRRIAGCRERLRRNRATHRIAEECAASHEGAATGEGNVQGSPALEARREETGRED